MGSMTSNSYSDPNTMAKIDGAKVRRLREEKGLTQLYLATFVGVTTDTVSRWENRRYQTVKQANALKLAEALEVPIDDILDQEEERTDGESEDSGATFEPHSGIAQKAKRRFSLHIGIAAGLLAIIAAGLYLYLPRREAPPFPSSQKGIRIIAERFLPDHCAPNQLFPVAIRVHSSSQQQVSLIIKEEVPKGLTMSASQPPFTAVDSNEGIVRWLLKAGQNKTQIFYLCKTPASVPEGQKYVFSGSITVKGQQPVPIASTSALEIAPYHWADSNRDYKISDEEILSAYDYYSEASELGINFDLIEEIWSAGGYQWDPVKQTFTVVQ